MRLNHYTTISSFLLLAGLGGVSTGYADELPAPVQALADQGLEIHGQFDAPGGLRGYGASAQGQDMATKFTANLGRGAQGQDTTTNLAVNLGRGA